MFLNDFKRYGSREDKLRQTGFTLIELVTVMIIIGILASVALPTYNHLKEKSRRTEALSTLKSILDAQKRYAFKHDEYVDDILELDIEVEISGKYFNFSTGCGADPYDEDDDVIAEALNDGENGFGITELGYFTVVTGSGNCPAPKGPIDPLEEKK